MKICVIGAPSTGKSVFAKSLAAELAKRGYSCELVQEYASEYIQSVGMPVAAWEQLVISIGQYLAEQKTSRPYMVTDASMFATYIYAQRLLPQKAADSDWPKYRNLLDILRILARQSLESYDQIFFMNHVFKPQQDGVRLQDHLVYERCVEINQEIEKYLTQERAQYHQIDPRKPEELTRAFTIITDPAFSAEPSAAKEQTT